MFTRNIIYILIISIVLLQLAWSKPTTQDETSEMKLLKAQDLCLQKTKYDGMEPAETDNQLTPTNQLLKFTLRAFQQLSLQYAETAKNISEHLQKDPEILNSKSIKIQEFKQNLTQFEEKYTLCDGLDELFDLAELYSNTTSFYYDLEESDLNVDSKLILSLLRKYGSEDLDNDFEKYFNVFVDNFEKKFEDLMENLRKDEDKASKLVLEWYDTFKALKNYDDKINAFEKFFTFFEPDGN
ncbi:hypothetical protein FF38_12683 [Lucilia cuprina]|uniref:Protein TsetseEP domain-containing protein n=1 Tax=Lucilia cuprina TaxID=7375 RepID=A0A0L0C6M9_LUCCU|nr:hypothetical protein FF38_12683 [Lucilia cuprina]